MLEEDAVGWGAEDEEADWFLREWERSMRN